MNRKNIAYWTPSQGSTMEWSRDCIRSTVSLISPRRANKGGMRHVNSPEPQWPAVMKHYQKGVSISADQHIVSPSEPSLLAMRIQEKLQVKKNLIPALQSLLRRAELSRRTSDSDAEDTPRSRSLSSSSSLSDNIDDDFEPTCSLPRVPYSGEGSLSDSEYEDEDYFGEEWCNASELNRPLLRLTSGQSLDRVTLEDDLMGSTDV